MSFQAPTHTPPNRLITPNCLRYQPVLTEPFAVPNIEALGMVFSAFLNQVDAFSWFIISASRHIDDGGLYQVFINTFNAMKIRIIFLRSGSCAWRVKI